MELESTLVAHFFFALLPCDTTFETYIKKHGPLANENGRFTTDFVTLIKYNY